MTETPMEKLKRLAGVGKTVQKEAPEKFDSLIKTAEIKKPENIEKRGGWRENAGRKPNEANTIMRASKKKLDEFYHGEVRVQVTDPKTGKSFIVNKPRTVRVAEALYKQAVENNDVSAQREFLNRAVGKVPDAVEGSDPNKPIRILVDF